MRRNFGVKRLETIVPSDVMMESMPAAEIGVLRSIRIKGQDAPRMVSGRPSPIKATYMTTSKKNIEGNL
jgi:hypothetical protein